MERRQLIKHSAFAVAAFAFSKDLFATQAERGMQKGFEGSNGGIIKIKLQRKSAWPG